MNSDRPGERVAITPEERSKLIESLLRYRLAFCEAVLAELPQSPDLGPYLPPRLQELEDALFRDSVPRTEGDHVSGEHSE